MDTLHTEIQQGLQKLNISKLNELQTKTLSSNSDIIVQSPTGSGKTLAYLLPIIKHIYKYNTKFTALIIAPTRELALQICEVSSVFCSSYCLIGNDGKRTMQAHKTSIKAKKHNKSRIDHKINKNRSMQSDEIHKNESHNNYKVETHNTYNDTECFDVNKHKILIATPGKLLGLLQNDNKLFKNIKYLILDEGDKLLSLGFETTITHIIAKLPKTRFTGLFTATIDDSVKKLSKLCLSNPHTIIEKEIMPQKLNIEYLEVTPFEKLSALLELIRNKKCIVFFATCAEVDFFYELISKVNDKVECKNSMTTNIQNNEFEHCKNSTDITDCANEKNKMKQNTKLLKIHGKLKNDERQNVYKNFTENECSLFCTDIAARGIDFKNVNYVIHFDAPLDPANFIHRSGRTARNNENGKSVFFVMKNEIKFINYLKIKKIEVGICKLTYKKLEYSYFISSIDENINKLAVIAFVAYIRSYKEYCLSYIFNLKEINFDSTIALFFLNKVPQMKELQNIKFKRFVRTKKKDKKIKR
ncbi:ATP-dependent rRNA helicase spb4 [Binucleata daphniae]